MRRARLAAISADRDRWTRQAFDACLTAAKDLVGVEGPIRPGVTVGHLVASEWGWLVSTVVSTWVRTRSEQASVEGWDYERAAHTIGLAPDPWVEGAVAAILPKLAEACPDLDWSQPVGEWPKSDVVAFLIAAFGLIQHAIAARDAAENPPGSGGAGPPGDVNPDLVERELNAAAGNGLLTVAEHRELNDSSREPPF
jgi:hypothetical protein